MENLHKKEGMTNKSKDQKIDFCLWKEFDENQTEKTAAASKTLSAPVYWSKGSWRNECGVCSDSRAFIFCHSCQIYVCSLHYFEETAECILCFLK